MTSEGTNPASEPKPVAKLLFRGGPLRGHVIALEKDRVSIGRDHRNDVAIDDSIVSSFHAAVVRDEDDSYWLEDAGSKNGTFLNGEHVEREQLRDGDVFFLCQTGPELQFVLGEPSLPSLLEHTTATFSRTRSFTRTLKELLPRGRSGLTSLLKLTGVRRILDYQLDEATRRARVKFLVLMAAFLLFSATALVATILIQIQLRDSEEKRSAGSSVAGAPATAGGAQARAVELAVRLDPIYGSLFLSYRDTPIGEAEVRNLTASPLTSCQLSFAFKDFPRLLVEPCTTAVPEIPPGKSVGVPISCKFSTEILSDQTREVAFVLSLSREGRTVGEISRAIFIHSRHVFNWEKPERVAVFIDQNDPAVVEFVRSVWKHRPLMSRQEFPPSNVVGALTLLTGLANLGLRYLPDSTQPLSAKIDGKANDSVNYPGETLLAGSGDCDDLSVLCCAVLECARIPTAFVVGSGHVFLLVDTGIGAASLPQTPLDRTTVVVRGDRVWMPIEATDFARPGGNFASAWSSAWVRRQAIESGEMSLVELKEAWRKYQPMSPPADPRTQEKVKSMDWRVGDLDASIAFALGSLRKLFQENLAAKIAEIEKREEAGPARQQATALLFAKSGLFDEARRVLERALFGDKGPREPGQRKDWAAKLGEDAMILLSDLALCMALGARTPADLTAAADYTELAVLAFPDSAGRDKGELMLRLALVHRLRGDLSAERSWSARAFEFDPVLRSTYENLMASDGTVAGPEEKVLEYLRTGVK